MFPAGLFVQSRDALAARQLGQHVAGREVAAGQQHETVKPEIGDLADERDFIIVLGGHYRLGRLLADLLQDRAVALRKQARDVRLIGRGALARFDRRRDPREDRIIHRCPGGP